LSGTIKLYSRLSGSPFELAVEHREVARDHALAARWLYRTEMPEASRRNFLFHRVPEAATHLYVVLEDDRVEARVTGPLQKLTRIPHRPRWAEIVGIELRPGAAREVLGIDVWKASGGTHALREIWGNDARELEREIADAPSEMRVAKLESILSERLLRSSARPFTRELAEYEDEIHRTSVTDLAARSGCSPRQLQRRWSAQVGLAPKLHGRLVRHRRVLQALASTSDPDWRKLAEQSGYADQPHLIREFGALMGIAPVQLLRDVDFVEQVLAIGWLVIVRGNPRA
jgi:AraC-like DNA-binding protein